MIALSGVLVLLALLAIGLPVALSLILAGSLGLLLVGGPGLVAGILATGPGSALSNYELLTIPMFLLMAEFMVTSGIAVSLFSAVAAWTRNWRGGLGIATALSGAAFGAISGSSAAAAATLSTSSVPSMLANGYERRFATGIVSISGTLAMIIPPSIALIFYGLLSGTDIAKLLIAGLLPGLLVTLTIALTVWYLLLRDPSLAPASAPSAWKEKLAALKVAGPFVVLFAMVTGLIYTGIATPVESSALGALGAFLLTLLSGKLTRQALYLALVKTCLTSCMIGLIVVCAHVFGTFLTMTGTTQAMVAAISDSGLHPYVILLVIVLIYLVLGLFLDQLSILILTVPIVLPLIIGLGFDPVWFGIIVILLAEVGIVTPPVGLNVFVVSRVTNIPVEEVFSGVWPHVIAHLILIAVLIAFPSIVLWLPSHMG
ncbi:MAG: TRAP transporter large permease [Candidimonas sp.]